MRNTKSPEKKKSKLLKKTFLWTEISREDSSEACSNFSVQIVGIYNFVTLLLELTTFSIAEEILVRQPLT